jgi:glucosylceramidase
MNTSQSSRFRPLHFGIAVLVVVTAIPASLSLCGWSDREDPLSTLPAPRGQPLSTTRTLVTSEAGARMEAVADVPFVAGRATGTVLTVWPDSTKQTIHGIGTSFTESSAYVLAHLPPDQRRQVMRRIFGEEGANFTLTRTHIGSCDFSVEGKYSYADRAGDTELKAFTIAPDEAGFDPAAHPAVKDPDYDLLPMIREALAIKGEQDDDRLEIIASAWTAPPWMKDIETWFIPGSEENGWQGSGGQLKPEYEAVYADYLAKYLDAYAAAGVDIWGLTPVNEPLGNGGNWESMNFSPESQNAFIKDHLGPRLARSAHADTRLLIFDQNRKDLEHWTDVIFADPVTSPYVFGVAVHWYASTFKVFEDAFDRVHAKFPEMAIIHTEGCIDNLGNPAPGGVTDPAGFQESGWFMNDAFWWNANATDWAYSVNWLGVNAADHPKYTPVHRYARNIIVSLDHWLSGWVDWNIVLDRRGGPNHVDNFCGAPIMIDTATGEIHYTPVFWVLAQFSRTIRPGDRAVWTKLERGERLQVGDLYACATVNATGKVTVQALNTTKQAVEFSLQIGEEFAEIEMPANAVKTIQIEP